MKALAVKLLRDLWILRGQTLAIALVVIGGIAAMVMAVGNMRALSETRKLFYERQRFADVFASLQRAPMTLLPELRALDGVSHVEGRIMQPVNLELAGVSDGLNALAVSLSESEQGLNKVYLLSGSLPRQTNETVVGDAFATEHGLHPGDEIYAIINGRRQTMRISGIGQSPEFIYMIRPGEIFPDFRHFAVLWMERSALSPAFDLDGAFNQLVLKLEREASVARIIDAVDRMLIPYGGLGAHGRELQFSHRLLDEELKHLAISARMFSTVILGVTAFLLSVVLGRLIGTQRAQIAVLKAYGYTDMEIARHYALLMLLLVGVGLPPALALGSWLGRGLAGIYMRFYRLPYLEWSLSPDVWLLALCFVLAATALGTAVGLRRVFKLTPAEAMRPESPPRFRFTLFERAGMGQLLDTHALMVLRNLERHPWRSVLSVLGIGLSCGVLVMSRMQGSAVEKIIQVQFGLIQREDINVTLVDPRPWRAIDELAALPGVQSVQAFRNTSVRLRHGFHSYRTELQGFDTGTTLRRLLDSDLRPIALPERGVMLSDHLAMILQVNPGDKVTVEFLGAGREPLEILVAGTVKEYLGVSAYVRRDWLNALLREGDMVTGALMSVEPDAKQFLLQDLRSRPRIAGVSDRNATVASFRATMAKSILIFMLVMTFMAASIAIGVVYSSARITLAERIHDLACLRTQGYSLAEVRRLLLGELAMLSLAALLPGLAIGWIMSAWLMTGFQSELYRVPLVLVPQDFALAGGVMLVGAGLAGWLVARQLRRTDPIEVLKARE